MSLALLLGGCTPFAANTSDGSDVTDATRVDDLVDEALPPTDAPVARVQCGVPITPCDVFTQIGCAADEACVVHSLDPLTTACVRPGSRMAGQVCIGDAQCRRGLSCVQFAGSRLCTQLCCADTDPDPCPRDGDPASHCAANVIDQQLSGCTVTGSCDYRDPGSCPDGGVCRPGTPLGASGCAPAGDAGIGQVCVGTAECAAGLTCNRPSMTSSGLCHAVCDYLDPMCPAGQSCSYFGDRPYDYGVCL